MSVSKRSLHGRAPLLALAVPFLLVSPACGEDDDEHTVGVHATMTEATASLVSTGGLKRALEGSFTVVLTLPAEAAHATGVALDSCHLLDDTTSGVFFPLRFTSTPSFPVSVDVGKHVTVPATFVAADNAVHLHDVTDLCAAPAVVIRIRYTDALLEQPTGATSPPFALQGCP